MHAVELNKETGISDFRRNTQVAPPVFSVRRLIPLSEGQVLESQPQTHMSLSGWEGSRWYGC